MRDAERLADAAGIVDILAGAARAGAVHGGAMIVELQGDAEHVIALALQNAGHDGTVDAADMATTTRVSSGFLSKSSVFTGRCQFQNV
jgi:hypothetical protein